MTGDVRSFVVTDEAAIKAAHAKEAELKVELIAMVLGDGKAQIPALPSETGLEHEIERIDRRDLKTDEKFGGRQRANGVRTVYAQFAPLPAGQEAYIITEMALIGVDPFDGSEFVFAIYRNSAPSGLRTPSDPYIFSVGLKFSTIPADAISIVFDDSFIEVEFDELATRVTTLEGSNGAVRFDEAQTLEEAEQAQARYNIGAVSNLTFASYRKAQKRLVATAQTSAADNNWRSVCWSPELNIFCAVAKSGSGNRVMTSPDGISWTIQTSAADNDWHSVCWSPELSLFCAVAYSGTGNRVMTSPDGISWTIQTSAADNDWHSVCWSPELSIFCAVAYSGTGNRVMTSPDGINWTGQTSAADNDWRSVCWSPELSIFCAVANSGSGHRN